MSVASSDIPPEGEGASGVCKWCLRNFSIPNPIVKRRGIKPTLERRVERSRECKGCVNFLFSHCKGLDKKRHSYRIYVAKQIEGELRSHEFRFRSQCKFILRLMFGLFICRCTSASACATSPTGRRAVH